MEAVYNHVIFFSPPFAVVVSYFCRMLACLWMMLRHMTSTKENQNLMILNRRLVFSSSMYVCIFHLPYSWVWLTWDLRYLIFKIVALTFYYKIKFCYLVLIFWFWGQLELGLHGNRRKRRGFAPFTALPLVSHLGDNSVHPLSRIKLVFGQNWCLEQWKGVCVNYWLWGDLIHSAISREDTSYIDWADTL